MPDDTTRTAENAALAEAWDAGAQAATDWLKDGAWLAAMPDNPYRSSPESRAT